MSTPVTFSNWKRANGAVVLGLEKEMESPQAGHGRSAGPKQPAFPAWVNDTCALPVAASPIEAASDRASAMEQVADPPPWEPTRRR